MSKKNPMTNVVSLPTLDDHLTECNERYHDVIKRLDNLDTRITRIELLALDIKTILLHDPNAGHYDN